MPLVCVAGAASRHYGSGAGGSPLFEDNFSSGDLTHTDNGFGWDGTTNVAVVSSTLCGGTYAARFTFGPDTTEVNDDSTAELRFEFGSVHTDIWVGYMLHIPSNYVHRWSPGGNNKGWCTMWDAGGDTTYGNPHVGIEPNFWDVGDGTSKGSVYIFGQSTLGQANGGGGTHLGPTENPEYFPNGNGIIEAADFGKVLEVVIHYKYATSANNNGVAEIWKRRRTPTTLAIESSWIKITDIQDGEWYAAGQEGFGYCYILGWANSGFTDETLLHLGNFWIATTDQSGASG